MKRIQLVVATLLYTVSLFAQDDQDTIRITVSSTDLSEDFSVASSKSDELLLFIYSYSVDGLTLDEPRFSKKFNFKEGKMQANFDWLTAINDTLFIFFLIELDSERSELQIDPVVRIHHQKLRDCAASRDYLCIEKYLGDEDLLGFGVFSIPSFQAVNGVYKLDKYNYTLEFKTN